MDCSMPIMDGYESSSKIRKFCRNNVIEQPMIIACTGHTEEEYIKKAWCNEIDEVVPKPVKTDLMITILEEMLDY